MTESSLLKLDQALKTNELKNVMLNDLQKETVTDVVLTSPDNSDTQKNLKNGVNECCEFIEIPATHGALLNGLLLWADIQRP